MTTCCQDDPAFWQEQLTSLRATVRALNGAILAFATSNIQNYQLDSGQTRQMVTRASLATLRDTRAELMNEIAMLEIRLGCASGSTHVVPGF
jgi:hypothetical protein